MLLVSLSDAGMNFALVRLPARLRAESDHTRANTLVKLGFLLKLAISTVVFLVCYFGSTRIANTLFNRPELVPFIQLASLMIVFQAIYDATNNSFIGRRGVGPPTVFLELAVQYCNTNGASATQTQPTLSSVRQLPWP
jgi:O-antigen/teichoic acid export membrane protein